MATPVVLQRIVRTRIPQRDARTYSEITFVVEGESEPVKVSATLLNAGVDVNAWADEHEADLEQYLKNKEWDRVVRDVEEGINPVRAEAVYRWLTKQEIAQRLYDDVVDPEFNRLTTKLNKVTNVRNRIMLFLGLV